MLSYRHAYHAGNHADVLKHIIWCEILRYMKKKSKPLYVHDTHAGAGLYRYDSDMMQKKQEYKDGIIKLSAQLSSEPEVENYISFLKDDYLDHGFYPGSPELSYHFLGEGDRMMLTEMHSTDFPLLKNRFSDRKNVNVVKSDAYDSLVSSVPPKEKRAAILIDPSYEIKEEYSILPKRLANALTKFPSAVFAIWYPVLARQETESFIKQLHMILKSKNHKNPITALRAELCIDLDRETGFGMTGSGMFIINPPYIMEGIMQRILPELVRLLSPEKGHYSCAAYE